MEQRQDFSKKKDTDLFFLIYRNKFIRYKIFNEIKKFNESLEYIRYNYYDFPLELIIKTNNKSLLIEKLTQYKCNNNNILIELKFNKKWFNLLFGKKWFDLELIKLIDNIFKKEILNYLTFQKEIDKIQLSESSKSLIENNNVKVLQYIDSVILKNNINYKFSLLGFEEFQKEYNKTNEYAKNYVQSFLYSPGIEGVYFNLKNGIVLKNLIEIQTFEYLKEKLLSLLSSPMGPLFQMYSTFSIHNLIIDNLNLLFERVPYDLNIHFQYIKEIFTKFIIKNENGSMFKYQIKQLLLLAIKFNDQNIFKLLFSNPKIIDPISLTNKRLKLIDFEIKDLPPIPFGSILENYELLGGDMFNVLYGGGGGGCDQMKSIRFKILKSGLLKCPTDRQPIYRFVDDPDVADYLLSNNDVFNCKYNMNFSINCIRNDLSNINLIEKNNLLISSFVNAKKDSVPSEKKLNYLMDTQYPQYFRSYILLSKTINNSLVLIEKFFQKFIHGFTTDDLIECSRSGSYNIVDRILDNDSINGVKGHNLAYHYNEALFQSLKDNNFVLFKKISTSLKRRDLISSSHCQFFDRLSRYPIPVDIEKRIDYLNCLNNYFKLERKGDNLIDMNCFLSFNFINFFNRKKNKNLDKFSREYLLAFLNDDFIQKLNSSRYSDEENKNEKEIYNQKFVQKFSKLISNNQILIDKFLNTILNQKFNFFRYLILNDYTKSFIYLFQSICKMNQDGFDDYDGNSGTPCASNYIIKLLPTIFNFITQCSNTLLLDFILHESIFLIKNNNSNGINTNQFLNHCHLLILIGNIKYPKSIVLSHLIKNDYTYSPPINGNNLDCIDDATIKLINYLSAKISNQKINIKNLIKFLKNVRLFHLLPTIQYHYIENEEVDEITTTSGVINNLVFKLNK